MDYTKAIEILESYAHRPELKAAIKLLEDNQPGYPATITIVGGEIRIAPDSVEPYMIKSVRLKQEDGRFVVKRSHSGGVDSAHTTWEDVVREVGNTLRLMSGG